MLPPSTQSVNVDHDADVNECLNVDADVPLSHTFASYGAARHSQLVQVTNIQRCSTTWPERS